jgi:spore coat protein JB
MTERDHAAQCVQKLHFALLDASLFLNSHPTDAAALRYFQQMKQEYLQAAAMYEKNFGALTALNAAGSSGWEWVSSPWPWEGVH